MSPGHVFPNGQPDLRERVSALPLHCYRCNETGYHILGDLLGHTIDADRKPTGGIYLAWHLWPRGDREDLGCAYPLGIAIPNGYANQWVPYGEHCDRSHKRTTDLVVHLIPVIPEPDVRFLPHHDRAPPAQPASRTFGSLAALRHTA